MVYHSASLGTLWRLHIDWPIVTTLRWLNWPVHPLVHAWGRRAFLRLAVGLWSELTFQIVSKTWSDERCSCPKCTHQFSGASHNSHSPALKGYSIDPLTSTSSVHLDWTRVQECYNKFASSEEEDKISRALSKRSLVRLPTCYSNCRKRQLSRLGLDVRPLISSLTECMIHCTWLSL